MMRTAPPMTPDSGRGRNRAYLLLLKILRIFLTVVFLSIGAGLVLFAFLIWKVDDLIMIKVIAGSTLFLVGGASFIALGIEAMGKWKQRP